jgi:hypothetical protein
MSLQAIRMKLNGDVSQVVSGIPKYFINGEGVSLEGFCQCYLKLFTVEEELSLFFD